MNYGISLSLPRGLKAVVGVAALCLASQAHATTISIGLSSAPVFGGAVLTAATDGGSGIVSFGGPTSNFGYFIINNISATGAPILNQGTLVTNSINVSGVTGSQLTVYITEQGLTAPINTASFLSSFTANLFQGNVTSVVESTLFSSSNLLYTGTVMGSSTFNTIGTTSSTSTLNVAGTYSETAVYVITVGSGGGTVNDTINITASSAATPEPSSLLMLGTGLMSAAGMLVRRRKIS